MSGLRRVAKRMAEVALARSGAAAVGRRLHGRRPLILAYHNVVPEGCVPCGERSLHVPVDDFRRQLDLLDSVREVVPLHDLWDPGAGGRPRAAITFDDAYRGAVGVGVREVVERGLSATIFVAPGLLGDVGFWWDRLAGRFGGVIPADLRERALRELRGVQSEVLSWTRRRGVELSEPASHARSATEEELREAASHRGIRVASHTWSHPNLAALDEDEVDEQLRRTRAWIDVRFEREGERWLSYPYGLESEEVRRIAADHHDAAVRVSGGFAPARRPGPADDGGFRLPRLNVPAGVTAENFELRLAGIVG